jgi:hypothetical protein
MKALQGLHSLNTAGETEKLKVTSLTIFLPVKKNYLTDCCSSNSSVTLIGTSYKSTSAALRNLGSTRPDSFLHCTHV